VYNPVAAGKEWYNGRNRLSIACSEDGKIWKDIYQLENKTGGEFSYPAIVTGTDGSILITYTYDRKNIKFIVAQTDVP
ncbi:MAG: sialidase, partial [Sphingobacteriales bacterium]